MTFISIVVFMTEHPMHQIMILIFLVLFVRAFFKLMKPYESNNMNKFADINMWYIQVLLYHKIYYTDLVSDSNLKYNIGKAEIGVSDFVIVTNLLVIQVSNITTLCKKFKI